MEGGFDFFKINKNLVGGGVKMFARKGGLGKIWGGGLSRNGGLPYYTEVFLEIPHDAA